MIFSFRIPLRFLRGSYSHFVLTVIALGCGVALVCAIDLVNRAVLRAFVEIIDTMAGRAALQVSAGESGLFPEEIAQKVSAVPGVELAVPVVNAAAFTTDDSGEMLTVQGVDIMSDAVVRVYDAHDQDGLKLDDPLLFLSQPDSIMLTRVFATRRGLKLDDRITLETPTGRRVFVIRGLLEAKGVARVFGGNLVVMDLYAAEAAFARPGFVSRVDVVLVKGADVAATSAAIAAVLPSGLRVEAPSQRKADLHKLMESFDQLLQGVSLIVLIAAFLIAYNRLTTVFEARAWQLGVLRAAGIRRGVVWRELLKESLLLGTAGAALGVPLGVGLGKLLLPVVATTTALGNNLVAPEAELGVNAASIVRAVLLGLTAAVIAAALPAWRAARQPPVETIRGRWQERESLSLHLLWRIRGAILMGTLVGVVAEVMFESVNAGLIATALIAIGTALDARLAVLALHKIVNTRIGKSTRPIARFAIAQLSGHPRRAALTAGTLGVGLGMVFWLCIIAKSFEASVVRITSDLFHADLIASSSYVSSGFLESPIDDRLLTELVQISDIDQVVGERLINWEYQGTSILVNAFDPNYYLEPKFGHFDLVGNPISGIWGKITAGESALASRSFELTFGAHIGDEIVLVTPNGPHRLQIAGITKEQSVNGTIQISRDLYKKLWNDDRITRALILKKPDAATADVRQSIVRALGNKYHLRVLLASELVEYFSAQVRRAFAAIPILAGLVLAIVLIGLADTLAANVADRVREFGTIRAVGARRSFLWRTVGLEAIILGGFGIALALSMGMVLGLLWIRCIFPVLAGWVEFSIPVAQSLVIVVVAMVVCLLAALEPARRVSLIQPADALRYE